MLLVPCGVNNTAAKQGKCYFPSWRICNQLFDAKKLKIVKQNLRWCLEMLVLMPKILSFHWCNQLLFVAFLLDKWRTNGNYSQKQFTDDHNSSLRLRLVFCRFSSGKMLSAESLMENWRCLRLLVFFEQKPLSLNFGAKIFIFTNTLMLQYVCMMQNGRRKALMNTHCWTTKPMRCLLFPSHSSSKT